MIKINVTEIIKDFDGTDLKDNEKPLSYRRALWISLNQPDRDDNADMKYRLFKLANKIVNTEEVSLTADDITLINKKVAVVYNPIVSGRIRELLEPPVEEEKKS